IKTLIQRWNIYKYRFLPWVAVNLSRGDIIPIAQDKLISDDDILQQLIVTFTALKERYNRSPIDKAEVVVNNVLGFQIGQKSSSIKEAGSGVFVTKGNVNTGQVVALYPGTVYLPSDSKFFQSLGNQFMFKCSDNRYIDGKGTGLSKSIFVSCANRDRIGLYEACDTTWIKNTCSCPLNVGQYVNNHTKTKSANVQYQEFDFTSDFPLELRKYIPNVNFDSATDPNFLRSIALISTRDIHSGEELLSSYFTVSH
uniref:SET domain-containing protein n=1 Tax=Ciona savignyi TaxID=51511 RepID=H2ZDB2_CIOSA